MPYIVKLALNRTGYAKSCVYLLLLNKMLSTIPVVFPKRLWNKNENETNYANLLTLYVISCIIIQSQDTHGIHLACHSSIDGT